MPVVMLPADFLQPMLVPSPTHDSHQRPYPAVFDLALQRLQEALLYFKGGGLDGGRRLGLAWVGRPFNIRLRHHDYRMFVLSCWSVDTFISDVVSSVALFPVVLPSTQILGWFGIG